MKLGRWNILLAAAGFNLLFEYSIRGYSTFLLHPLLPVFLFTQYIAIFAMLNDIIVKFKLSSLTLIFATWPIGLIPMVLGTGIVFYKPQFLGINIVALLFVELCWWWLLQGVITLYFANRITARDWKPMTQFEWAFTAGYFVGSFIIIRLAFPPTHSGSLLGWISIIIIFLTSLLAFVCLVKISKNTLQDFKRDKTLDFLSFGSIAVFIFIGTYLGGNSSFDTISSAYLNHIARNLIILWSIFCAVVLGIRRLICRQEVSI